MYSINKISVYLSSKYTIKTNKHTNNYYDQDVYFFFSAVFLQYEYLLLSSPMLLTVNMYVHTSPINIVVCLPFAATSLPNFFKIMTCFCLSVYARLVSAIF